MRLNFPNSPLTTHRNVLIVCVSASVVFAGALSVYSKLISELEDSACLEPRSLSDAKAWLQAMLLALCVFVSGSVYSFFSLYRC